MPHHKSAVKRIKTADAARQRNRENRARLRTSVKNFRALAKEGQTEEARQQLPAVYSEVDVQARKGVIPKKRAARLKSRLAALTNK